MITVFLIMTGKWVEGMHATMNIFGTASCIYFLQIVFFGHFLLLNIFISILLKAWEEKNID
jgi:hypothetical protein